MKYYECDMCKRTAKDELPEYWYKIKKYCKSNDAFYEGLLKQGNIYLCPNCARVIDAVISGDYAVAGISNPSSKAKMALYLDEEKKE